MIVLGICLFAANGWVQGHTFCVASSEDLQAALDQSSDGGAFNSEDNFVGVVAGTYFTGAAPFTYTSTGAHQLIIQGGYHDALCTSPSILSHAFDSRLSILDGHSATGVMKLRGPNGLLSVSNLTFQNGESVEPGAGLQVNYGASVNTSVGIGPNIIRDNHTSSYAGGLYAFGSGEFGVAIVQNLIVDNKADSDDGGAYVLISGSVSAYVQNNTIANNLSGTGPIGGLRCGGSPGFNFYNNIVWGNNDTDVYLSPGKQFLLYNDYGSLIGPVPFDAGGNLSSDPRFVNAGVGNFHLAGNSPALGISSITGLVTDVEGKGWPRAGRVDPGAYEETIFIDGFDGD